MVLRFSPIPTFKVYNIFNLYLHKTEAKIRVYFFHYIDRIYIYIYIYFNIKSHIMGHLV
jgi:hypothetical protein